MLYRLKKPEPSHLNDEPRTVTVHRMLRGCVIFTRAKTAPALLL